MGVPTESLSLNVLFLLLLLPMIAMINVVGFLRERLNVGRSWDLELWVCVGSFGSFLLETNNTHPRRTKILDHGSRSEDYLVA